MCFESSTSATTHATPHEGGEERPEQEAVEWEEEEEEVLGVDVVTHVNGDHSPCSQQPLTTYHVCSAGPCRICCLTQV